MLIFWKPQQNNGKPVFRVRFQEFLKETFRPHTKEEYKEFFTRGIDGGEKLNRKYPWLYMRALALMFMLFAFVTIVMKLSSNSICYPTTVFLGGLLINLPFLVLLYELYPERDLSFATLTGILVIPSLVGAIITQFGYMALSPQNKWVSTVWTAVLEEFCKAFPAILTIVLLKKRSPLSGFVIAAAIGAGYSVSEDMGYIFNYSLDLSSGIDVSTVVQMSLVRGVTSVSTHIVWAGFIGWAFCKFRRPFINFRFYAVCLLSVALHFLWDIPLGTQTTAMALASFAITVFCFVLAIMITEQIFIKERKLILSPEIIAGAPVQIEFYMPPKPVEVMYDESLSCRHKGNLFAAICGTIIAACAVLYCLIPIGIGKEVREFNSERAFLNYVQDGKDYTVDWNREFDASAKNNFAEYVVDGKLVEATQTVILHDCKFYYTYNLLDGAVLTSVDLVLGDELYPCSFIEVAAEDGQEAYIYYFSVLPDVVVCIYDEDYDIIKVYLNKEIFYGKTPLIAICVMSGVSFLTGACAYTGYKIKARKLKRV